MNNFRQKGMPATVILTLLFILFLSFPASGQGGFTSIRAAIISTIVIAFSAFVMFMILKTGNISPWRKIFFTTYAVSFAISFVWWTMGDRGHMWLLDQELLYSQAPMCHIVVPMLLLPILFTKEIIFPVAFYKGGGIFMLLIVIVVSIIYGRAFCSWGCFYGGQDELFSSTRKKKVWKIKNLHPFVRYFSFALLAFIILHSFATMSPTYCMWFCPFKATSEFIEVNSFLRVIQTFIFVGLWLGLVIILPLLTKKRIQCGLFCPMGAFLSCTSKINLFNIKIDKNKCNECKRCERVCPTFSMTSEAIVKGKPLITCTKCGTCIDACKEGAISINTLGVPFSSVNHPILEGRDSIGFWRRFIADVWDPKVIFIFGIFSVGTLFAFSFFTNSISRLLNFFLGV